MLRQNPLQNSRVFDFKEAGSSVYGRVETLMNSEKGLIGLAWSSLRQAWFSEEASRLIVVRYDSLARDPGATLAKSTRRWANPHSLTTSNNLNYETAAYDADLGMPAFTGCTPLSGERPEAVHTARPVRQARRIELLEQPGWNPHGALVL